VPQQPFENRVDVISSSEDPFDPRATASGSMQDNEISDGRVADALAIDDYRRARLEEGIADEKLPAAGKLGYEGLQELRGGDLVDQRQLCRA
jgi:hypothetical protein